MPTKPSLAILVLGATAAAANAQCTNYWVPGYASGHVGAIDALTVLSDGDLVTGWADFAFLTAHVSRWNGSTWSEMTPPLTGGTFATIVAAFALLANGDLIVGGGFTQAGSVAARGIARWDGQNWHSLGIGLGGPPPGFATTLLLLDNGDLVVGGSFARAGGLPAPNIARWDGVAWSPMGAGLSGLVSALVQMPNGDVIAGGSIYPSGAVPGGGGASWNRKGGASGTGRVHGGGGIP
ncbi:MAG: hypothetical protein KDE27_21320, partial [Planctomycetes bacterium]|nr:hypothetical protein [Planctomycetota bacterium]